MKVYNALRWLHENNPFYREVIIDRGNLEHLPENGNVSHTLHSVLVTNTEDTEDEAADESMNCDVHHSGVTVAVVPKQGEAIRRHLAQGSSKDFVSWFAISTTATNAFNNEGYMACAFSASFPFGTPDFRSPRSDSVCPPEYFQH